MRCSRVSLPLNLKGTRGSLDDKNAALAARFKHLLNTQIMLQETHKLSEKTSSNFKETVVSKHALSRVLSTAENDKVFEGFYLTIPTALN